jgi:hypothetical protein
MNKDGKTRTHGPEYYSGIIARQQDLDPHVLAIMVSEQLTK